MDPDHAVQIADRTWWVGHQLPGDNLQCHVYLIEQGDQSILLDPGSSLTFAETRRKIEEVIPFSSIRWFVCHHQDPDIAGSLPLVEALVERGDAAVVTHWRAQALIKHYGVSIPYWLVDQNEWRLPLQDRVLRFIFTPYAHFPGAFCTFDESTGVLFSSDLFGGYTDEPSLFARDPDYFESMRLFHEHYIPSRDVLLYALTKIEAYPVDIIAPQHGSIIPRHLVADILEKLKRLECGLYLMGGESGDTQRISQLNSALRDINKAMIDARNFQEIADRLLTISQCMLPTVSLEFHARLENDRFIHWVLDKQYQGTGGELPEFVEALSGIDRESWNRESEHRYQPVSLNHEEGRYGIRLPLFKGEEERAFGVVVLHLSEETTPDNLASQLLEQMSLTLQVAVERETIFRGMEMERQKFYERSIRDSLTGLFTRFYMEDTLQRLFKIHDRNGGMPVALAMLDIDHFKDINDRYGHIKGDEVLRQVAQIVSADARAGDLPVRLGGEEFGIFVVGESTGGISHIAERLRRKVTQIRFSGILSELGVTVSIGTAIRQSGEVIPGFIERADLALYQAKQRGRNRVFFADTKDHSNQWSLHFD